MMADHCRALGELLRKKCGDPLSAAEVEEESKLGECIARQASNRSASGSSGSGGKSG